MPTAVKTESIAAMVKRLIPDHIGTDALSKAVLAELGNDHAAWYSALQEVLPVFCSRTITTSRKAAATGNQEEEEDDETPPPAPSEAAWVSPRAKAQHDWYQTWICQQISGVNGMVSYAQATVDDLMHSAELRRSQAAGAVQEAARLEALADALRRYGKLTVAELPEAVVEDIMRRHS